MLIHSRWPALLVTTLALALSPSAACAAESFFRNCETAIESHGFARLKRHYATNKDEPRPDMCFKLNRDEFLVTIEDTGRIGQGLYYYDARENSYGLVDGQYCPNIGIEKEFWGPGKKRYVLIKCSNLHDGDWHHGYSILYLVPDKQRRSFVLKELVFAREDPESGLCGRRPSQSATSIEHFRVIGEGSRSVRLEFAVEEEDCVTHGRRKHLRAFQLRDGKFVETGMVGK